MSAAAAPAPRRIDAEKRRRARFVMMPFEIVRTMGRCGVPRAELLIVQNIILETLGAIPDQNKRRPEWATVTEEQFAEWCCIGVSGVRKAIQALEDDRLIEISKSGRNSRYRVLTDNVVELEKREKRSVERREPIAVGERRSVDLKQGTDVPLEFPSPVNRILFEPRVPCDDFVLVTKMTEQGAVLILAPKTATPVAVSRKKVQSSQAHDVLVSMPRSAANTATPVAVLASQLKSLLAPIFMDRFGYPPRQEQLEEIAAKLPAAAMEDFERVVRLRLGRKGPAVKPGLFLFLAEDAAEACNHRAAEKALAPPTLPAPSFLCEPEDSTSEWAKLRAYLSTKINSTGFSNWFGPTRQDSLEGALLRVATPDQVTAAFLNDEYGPEITAAIEALDLNCVAVEFFPEGDS